MAAAVDWDSKPEPWRSIGLEFRRDLVGLVARHRPDVVDAAFRAPIAPGSAPPRLKAFRHARGWFQHELAERAGLEKKCIQRAEAGTQNLRPATKAALATALGVEVTDIWPI